MYDQHGNILGLKKKQRELEEIIYKINKGIELSGYEKTIVEEITNKKDK